MVKLIRKAELLQHLGIKKSTLHNRIKDGLFPPPIKISTRAIAWPDYEVEEMIVATIASGCDDQFLKELVLEILCEREHRIYELISKSE